MSLTHLTQRGQGGAAPPDGFPAAPPAAAAAVVVLLAQSHSGALVMEVEALQWSAKPD